jgi:hypothetical protein
MAIVLSLFRTAGRMSVSKTLHGNMYKPNAAKLADLFSKTKIAVEYRISRESLISYAQMLPPLMMWGHAPVATVSFLVAYAFQFYLFWSVARYIPPSVLILGTSSPEFGVVVAKLRGSLHPHRIMEMLDSKEEADKNDHFPNNRLDNFRTTPNYAWEKVFQVLLDVAPVVLLDGRSSTTNLKYEAEIVAKTKHKAVIIICTNNRSELIDGLGPGERAF